MTWLFGTKEGRQQVLESTQYDRLLIVTFRREHKYGNWDEVQAELENCVRHLAPAGLCDNTDIPFLSLGCHVGMRITCYEGKSDISGSFVVEDVKNEDHELRRLVFLDNPHVIQSEARLKEGTNS